MEDKFAVGKVRNTIKQAVENTVALVAMRERSPLRWQPNARVSQFA